MKIFNLYISYLYITLLLAILVSACNSFNQSQFIGNYKRDKFVTSDTSTENTNKIDNSIGWTISLKDENIFQFKNADSIITGKWSVRRMNKEFYYLKLEFENKILEGVLINNIIRFEKPNWLFKNTFQKVLFVKTSESVVTDDIRIIGKWTMCSQYGNGKIT